MPAKAKVQPKARKSGAKATKSTARSARPSTGKSATRARPAAKKATKPATKRSESRARTVAKAKQPSKPTAKRVSRTSPRGGSQAPVLAPAPAAIGKLSQVALTATDLDATVKFYNNVLGFKLMARIDQAGFVFFNLGGGVRLLASATASQASLYFNVDDLDASVLTLKKRGVKFLQKPAMIHRDDDGDFGKKGVEEWMAFFHDPSGNLLALIERR